MVNDAQADVIHFLCPVLAKPELCLWRRQTLLSHWLLLHSHWSCKNLDLLANSLLYVWARWIKSECNVVSEHSWHECSTEAYVLLCKGLRIGNLNSYNQTDSRYMVATTCLHPPCEAHFSLLKSHPATMLLSQHSASFKCPCWRPDKQTSSQTYYIYSVGGD